MPGPSGPARWATVSGRSRRVGAPLLRSAGRSRQTIARSASPVSACAGPLDSRLADSANPSATRRSRCGRVSWSRGRRASSSPSASKPRQPRRAPTAAPSGCRPASPSPDPRSANAPARPRGVPAGRPAGLRPRHGVAVVAPDRWQWPCLPRPGGRSTARCAPSGRRGRLTALRPMGIRPDAAAEAARGRRRAGTLSGGRQTRARRGACPAVRGTARNRSKAKSWRAANARR